MVLDLNLTFKSDLFKAQMKRLRKVKIFQTSASWPSVNLHYYMHFLCTSFNVAGQKSEVCSPISRPNGKMPKKIYY